MTDRKGQKERWQIDPSADMRWHIQKLKGLLLQVHTYERKHQIQWIILYKQLKRR